MLLVRACPLMRPRQTKPRVSDRRHRGDLIINRVPFPSSTCLLFRVPGTSPSVRLISYILPGRWGESEGMQARNARAEGSLGEADLNGGVNGC
jgi:hypothetical protein